MSEPELRAMPDGSIEFGAFEDGPGVKCKNVDETLQRSREAFDIELRAARVLALDQVKRFFRERWLERCRTNPEKMRRVLADIEERQKSPDLVTPRNPAAVAEHCWKEFS